MESAAFKKLVKQMDEISTFIEQALEARTRSLSSDFEETYVSSEEVKQFLGISERTMQRIRSQGLIPYSKVRGKAFYKIKDIREMMENQIIRTGSAKIEDLIAKIQENAL